MSAIGSGSASRTGFAFGPSVALGTVGSGSAVGASTSSSASGSFYAGRTLSAGRAGCARSAICAVLSVRTGSAILAVNGRCRICSPGDCHGAVRTVTRRFATRNLRQCAGSVKTGENCAGGGVISRCASGG
ncbi:hypothetical protein NHF46_09695 [Arthrobacter alpinus]|nr:hypothetical protein [Arthrobacter alpinus]